jgi:hypothetical protein
VVTMDLPGIAGVCIDGDMMANDGNLRANESIEVKDCEHIPSEANGKAAVMKRLEKHFKFDSMRA